MPTPDQLASAISAGVKAALAALPPEPAAVPAKVPTPKLAYSLKNAGVQIDMSESTIQSLVERGELPSIKPAGVHRRLIRHDDLVAFLARQQPVAPGTAD